MSAKAALLALGWTLVPTTSYPTFSGEVESAGKVPLEKKSKCSSYCSRTSGCWLFFLKLLRELANSHRATLSDVWKVLMVHWSPGRVTGILYGIHTIENFSPLYLYLQIKEEHTADKCRLFLVYSFSHRCNHYTEYTSFSQRQSAGFYGLWRR